MSDIMRNSQQGIVTILTIGYKQVFPKGLDLQTKLNQIWKGCCVSWPKGQFHYPCPKEALPVEIIWPWILAKLGDLEIFPTIGRVPHAGFV